MNDSYEPYTLLNNAINIEIFSSANHQLKIIINFQELVDSLTFADRLSSSNVPEPQSCQPCTISRYPAFIFSAHGHQGQCSAESKNSRDQTQPQK